MREIFSIDDTVENRISFYLLACLLVVLPYDFFYSQVILICFGFHCIFHLRKQQLKNIMTKPVLVQVSFYLLAVAGLLYSQDKDEAFSIITRQWAILIMPLLFSISNFNLQKYKLRLLCIFGFGCTASILYLYVDALHTIHYFQLPYSSLFSLIFMNHNFSMPLKLHATYLSIYVALSLVIFLYLLCTEKPLRQKWVYILCTGLLFAGLIQLSSRSVFIAFLMIMNLGFPFFLFKGKKRVLFFLTASLISAATLFMIGNVDSFKTRYISELKTDLTDHVTIIDNTEPRLARWEAIFELVKRSPIIGYGTGAERKELKEKFFEKRLYFSYLNEFNAHNQYLSILIRLGLIGLALFLYILYFGFATALRNRDILFLGFLVIITVVGVSENFLDMDRGVFFYSFFLALFLANEWQEVLKPVYSGSKTGNPA